MNMFVCLVSLLLAGIFSPMLIAQEHRQHGAHQHGVGRLSLAQEGTEIRLELDSPAANIVGFEYAPSSEADREASAKAISALKQGEQLFRFSKDADCRLVDVEVDALSTDYDVTPEPEEEVSREKARRSSMAIRHEHGHDERPDRGNEHVAHSERHADITAAYRFVCAHPQKLRQLDVGVFRAFPATERLQVQFVTATRQGAVRLTAPNNILKF